jgi:ferrous iron transport protein B
MPVVLLGVLFINILMYFKVFDAVTGLFAPLVVNLFGLPKDAIVALAVGFLRKDVAVGLLAPLNLNIKQLFIASTLLAVSFPCVATFFVLLKELGLKALLKSTLLMIGISILVGTLLNFVILR